ncbi:MAG: DNA polymerase III subunit beta [Chloroflexota bacterium]
MKTSVLQDKLAKGLSTVARAVENRPTLPVLGNILIATEDARLKLSATNLEMSITTWIGAKVDREGAITLPAKTLADLVNNLSPERVDLTLDSATQTVNVRCGATNSNIKGIDAAEFPLVPQGGEADVVLSGKVLKEMIAQTVFAAAKEDNRPILTGVHTQLDGNVMTMTAADGYRLAVRTTEIDQHFPKPVDIVIPARALAEIGRVIGEEDEEVSITLPKDRDIVLFHMKYTDIATQLLEGKFPDVSAIIPRSYITSSTMYTSDLLAACKRAEIFARDSAYSAKLLVKPASGPGEPGAVTIVGMSAERGDNEGMLDASVEGEQMQISFNIRYLIEVLNVIGDERVVFESNGAANPGVIRPENRDDFVYVAMPMAVNR